MNQKKKNQKLCSLTYKVIQNVENYSQNRLSFADKILQRKSRNLTLQTLKLIFKAKKFSSEQKVLALLLLRDLCFKGNYEFHQQVENIIMPRLLEMITSVQNGTWQRSSQILFNYSQDQNLKWGMRFYFISIELIRELGTKICPITPKGEDSSLKKIFEKLQKNAIMKEKTFYLNSKLEEYAQIDEEILNQLESNKEIIDKFKKEFSYVDKIRKMRKKYLQCIFSGFIFIEDYQMLRDQYKSIVNEHYQELENLLTNEKEELKKIFKELQLAMKIFETEKNHFAKITINSQSMKDFKLKVNQILLDLFGGLPSEYKQNLEILPEVKFRNDQDTSNEINKYIESNSKIIKFKYDPEQERQSLKANISELKEQKKHILQDIHSISEKVNQRNLQLLMIEYEEKDKKLQNLQNTYESLRMQLITKNKGRYIRSLTGKQEVEYELKRIKLSQKLRRELLERK